MLTEMHNQKERRGSMEQQQNKNIVTEGTKEGGKTL